MHLHLLSLLKSLYSYLIPIIMIANKENSPTENPSVKRNKCVVETQIWLRFLAIVTTLASSCVLLTAKQSIVLYGIHFNAKYSQSSAFKFFAIANLIACGFSVISMFFTFIIGRKAPHPKNYFYMFLHDLIVMTLLMAGCAAATAIGHVGRYGNSYSGWMPICEQFAKFCRKNTVSVILSYLSCFIYFALTIISAHKSRQIYMM